MADPKGFLSFLRENNQVIEPLERIKNFNDFHIKLNETKRCEQAARCMNCGVPFCGAGIDFNRITIGCPLHNLIPEWNELVYHGNYREAYERLAMTTPFPEFTSHVCPALCEAGCVCNINGNPVSIKETEEFIIENAFQEGYVLPKDNIARNNKKIAIIGSGPAGLAAANALNRKGYNITVYEKDDRIGGLLMYGIPNMKLEKEIVDRRIDILKKESITFITNTHVGETISPKALIDKYDAVILSTGSPMPRDLNIKGRNLKNIVFAVEYLKRNTVSLLDRERPGNMATEKNVVIIGGGDTGNDCIATAIRQKAKSIIQFEITPKPSLKRTNEWPNWPNNIKIDYGVQENIALTGKDPREFNASVVEFMGDEKVKKVLVNRVSWVDGKIVPTSEVREYEADLVLIAMGFVGSNQKLIDSFNLESKNGNILTNNYLTNVKKVFACGDAKTGQSLVVKAIKSGIECSQVVDEYLKQE